MPAPPGPVSVTRREAVTRPRTSASSPSRPMKLDTCAGRLLSSFGLSSDRRGGKAKGRPSASSWKIRSGGPRSFSRCRPRSLRAAPAGIGSRSSAAAVAESTTWPPWAVAAMRAARWTSRPTRPCRCLGRLAGMDAHPDADRLTVGPWVRPERPLHLDGRGHARAGRGEHREERVALGVDLPAAVRGQPGTDQPVVRGEDLRVRIAQALQQRRRALDVGEEKSERQRGQRPEAFI